MNKLVWYIKQLFPLTYRSRYGVVSTDGGNQPHFSVWKMWLGHVYKHDDYILADCSGE